MEGAALALKSPTQLSAYRGLFAGKVEERKERLHNARLPGEFACDSCGGGTRGCRARRLRLNQCCLCIPQVAAAVVLQANSVHQAATCLHTTLHCAAEEAEAVHRVAWSLHGSGGAAWLASAGAAGLVRCQWIASQ